MFRTNGQPIDGGETFFDRNSFYGYAFNTSEDPYVGYRFRSIDEPIRYDEFGKWMGFTEKYFLTAILPSEDKTTLFAEPVNSAELTGSAKSVVLSSDGKIAVRKYFSVKPIHLPNSSYLIGSSIDLKR